MAFILDRDDCLNRYGVIHPYFPAFVSPYLYSKFYELKTSRSSKLKILVPSSSPSPGVISERLSFKSLQSNVYCSRTCIGPTRPFFHASTKEKIYSTKSGVDSKAR
jgi:hypothetical protein